MADGDKLPVQRSSQAEVDAFLHKVATLVPAGGARRGRLIFAMDATASREPTWDRACRIQGEMFEATAGLGGLDVQLVFYRGFRECKASPWVATAPDLLRRMTAVHCLAGQTQIGRVLAHAIGQTKRERVNAVVFVGDCMEEDIDALAQTAGGLGLLGVPVFLFHEGADPAARAAFETIAQLTGGACCPFDTASAQQLRDLLAAVAVFAAGGPAALEDFGRRRGGAVGLLTSRLSANRGG